MKLHPCHKNRLYAVLAVTFLWMQAAGQNFNNEWINFSQTYYKFKIGRAGLYRIPTSVLNAAGIGNTAVENFELWRNGERVPFYPSVSSGVLPANGYIEFWGKPNDGVPDRPMYRNTAFQHSTALSLITDTAVYFLSVNASATGFLVANASNNVQANTLAPEPYFLHSAAQYFKSRIHPGFAASVGELVYSSSYDKGEFWSSNNITPIAPLNTTISNLYPYTIGPASQIRFGAAGSANNNRNVRLSVNNTTLKDTLMDFFNDLSGSVEFPTTLLSSGAAAVRFSNTSAIASDRMVASFFSITYPRIFNFGGAQNFEFSLPSDADGFFLDIENFNHGPAAPVLYDLTQGKRYIGDISVAGKVRFALPPQSEAADFVLCSQDAANLTTVQSMAAKTFIDYRQSDRQGNYLIIYNPLINVSGSGRKPVEDYMAYRSSPDGGGFQARMFDINELIDQFAFGIRKHPLSVRNFIRFVKQEFSSPVKNVFLIGRGMTYNEYRINQSDTLIDRLDLIPTFGNPGSDNIFTSATIQNAVPEIPIGRLSVVMGSEVEDYLEKVKEYESVQRNAPQTLEGREWMKNLVHVTGASDPFLGGVLCSYMDVYKRTIEDTLSGNKVHVFCKNTTNPVQQGSAEALRKLFETGMSMMTYFGHSSATTLEFNIENPQNYNNPGKYPVFYVNGCNAGNFFTYYPQRLQFNETLSEKFVLAKRRGSVAFIASTHFGIVNYLNVFLTNLYDNLAGKDHGKTLGEIQQSALQSLVNVTGTFDYYSRLHVEEITLHGDPALRLNVQPKPDYVVEPSSIKIDPSFVSVAVDSFRASIRLVNLSKALPDSVRVLVKRQLPDNSVITLFNRKIPSIRFSDSLVLSVPIVANRDKGSNVITVQIDPEGAIEEMSENNNSASKEFFIFEDECRPVFPYNFSIVGNPSQKLYASTANPFASPRGYVMEMDTTLGFQSPFKITRTLVASGGVLAFDPGISFSQNTVYYWRVSPQPESGGTYRWNQSSFLFLRDSRDGFNQSHRGQQTYSKYEGLSLDTLTGEVSFQNRFNQLFLRNGNFLTSAFNDFDFSISVNGITPIQSACVGNSLTFCVFDPITFRPWKNVDANGANLFRYGSASANCRPSRNYNFEFSYLTAADRKKIMNFMDSIPNGFYVAIRSFDYNNPHSFSATWKGDTALYGKNNSLYHKLLAAGFLEIDSLNRFQCWLGVYKKNDLRFNPKFKYSSGIYDAISMEAECFTPDSLGFITSPVFGPSRRWDRLVWNGKSLEDPSSDQPVVQVIGIDDARQEQLLFELNKGTTELDISSIPASTYPYMKMRMRNVDTVKLTPYQLNYWRILYDPVPEGALSPSLYFTSKDTLEAGEPLAFGVAFKNISNYPFDSLTAKLVVTDSKNVPRSYPVQKSKALASGDTVKIGFTLDTKDLLGANNLFLDVNPDYQQPEQYLFNNILFRSFYVKPDLTNPLLDVTFDGVHILNRDIVSARPYILIKLKDEARYLLLNDTALVTVQVRYPNGKLRSFRFDGDTLRFTPAVSGTDNTATIEFKPSFLDAIESDGELYELIVKGVDKSNNKAGEMEYRVAFSVIAKPMISNLLNYPNPFSSSTAFVFTLTGSVVPEQFTIQVLTVTGKIVREITREELGPLHIGRNITTYKWDGTDQYGQPLANGIYLYRVVTSLQGQRLEKFKSKGEQTEKFFNNGYGKMYLMR